MGDDKTTVEFTRRLPGGVLDDSTYSQIEHALDCVEAPMTAAIEEMRRDA